MHKNREPLSLTRLVSEKYRKGLMYWSRKEIALTGTQKVTMGVKRTMVGMEGKLCVRVGQDVSLNP